MEQIIKTCNPKPIFLAAALRNILKEGLDYSDGCVLLKSQLKLVQPNTKKQFQDKTGYECFVNHLHLEDVLASVNNCVLLEQALAFANELSVLKSKSQISEKLEYVIVADENEVNVRFYVLRAGQNWLAEDLETYSEAVAAMQLPEAH